MSYLKAKNHISFPIGKLLYLFKTSIFSSLMMMGHYLKDLLKSTNIENLPTLYWKYAYPVQN